MSFDLYDKPSSSLYHTYLSSYKTYSNISTTSTIYTAMCVYRINSKIPIRLILKIIFLA